MKAILDDNTMAPWRGTEPGAVVLGELEVRPALPGEMQRVAALLNDEHYLGAGRQVGRTLVQIVHHGERWAAILVWGPAAMKLIDRDEWIGWTQQQRAGRLGLIVQNRRFLVIAETRMPNLASRAMGLGLRQLPGQWEEKHGYRPLLAETFTDIESFEGTCYKASNWEPCGLTKGFEPTHRADFYREHKRPKKLWLKTLSRNTRVILTGMDLPAAYQRGCNLQTTERALPLKKAHVESLRDVLREVPDPRARNRSWPISTLLALDGKYIRDLLLTLSLSEHESGAPVAVTIASKEPKSDASKTEGELTAAKRLYQKVDLRNAVVTGDALHCERENMQLVIENDGDFLFQLKSNQPTALTEAERIAAAGSPLLPAKQKIAGTAG
jgi:hypothetical protein